MTNRYWAEQLSSPGRPQWVTKALMAHFWPKPLYDGVLPVTGADDTEAEEKKLRKAMKNHLADIQESEKDAMFKVSMIKADDILQAFEAVSIRPPFLICSTLSHCFLFLVFFAAETQLTRT